MTSTRYDYRAKRIADTLFELAEIHDNPAMKAIAERVQSEFVNHRKEMTLKEEHAAITAAAETLRPQGQR